MDPCKGKIVCFHAWSFRHFGKNYCAYRQWHGRYGAFVLAAPLMPFLFLPGIIINAVLGWALW